MAKKFDSKIFNGEVFLRYLNRIPDTKKNKLLEAGVFRRNPELIASLGAQVGGNYIVRPLKGLIGGDPVNYDGKTDIPSDSTDTYKQGIVVVGRAKGFTEKDFSYDITGGVDFMGNVAEQLSKYWQNVDQDTLIKILNGIFKVTDFAKKHTYAINGEMGVTSLNSAIQKACGDNKNIFSVAIMHSTVATQLENKQLLEYLKYTDKNGVTSNLNMGTWNGRLVLIDDSMPAENVAATYALTTDTALDSSKTYYTKSGTKYTVVTSPDVANISTYYELTSAAKIKYTTYVLGEGAFEYEDVGAKVPVEMSRNPSVNGGEDTLYSRQRKVFAPFGFTFDISKIASDSPTAAELEAASAWKLVSNSTEDKTIDMKSIPIVAITSTADVEE